MEAHVFQRMAELDATHWWFVARRNILEKVIERDAQLPKDARILEIGCGTGRNLIILAKKHPKARFFGLDASAAMLKTAQGKADTKNLKNITFKTALAGDFTFDQTFGLNEKFDVCFFSYAVSIIPPWRESLENAWQNLKSGGNLYIVDFYDQKDLPVWFQKVLKSWLRQFHVKYPEDLVPFLHAWERQGAGKLKISPLYRRYSLIADFHKTTSELPAEISQS